MQLTTLLVVLTCGIWTTQAQNNHPFPDSDWSIWTPCTEECDVGYTARHNCDPSFQIPPLVGMPPYDVQTPTGCSMFVAGCNGASCTNIFDWQPFSSCDSACGTGARTRSSGPNCIDSTCPINQDIKCNTQSCGPLTGCADADIVFVLDSSSSIGDYYFYVMKQLVIDSIKAFQTGNGIIRVALVTYSTTVAVNFDFNEYFAIPDIEAAIWGIPPMGDTTNTADGIRKARMLFEDEARDGVEKFMVVVSDGNANIQREQVIPQANSARELGVKIFVVGVGTLHTAELNGVANTPAAHFVHQIDDPTALPSITQSLTDGLCVPGFDEPDPCDPNLCQNGGICNRAGAEYTCQCDACWTGANCDEAISVCTPNPCMNGQCTQVGCDATCVCDSGWTGDLCDTQLPSGGYNCGDNNPCTQENIDAGQFYFAHDNPVKFVQCDESGQCFVKPCGPGTVWDPVAYTCNWPVIR